MRIIPSFGSAVTGLLSATGLVSKTAPYANSTFGLISSTGPYANSTSGLVSTTGPYANSTYELTRGTAPPIVLPGTPKVISVTNTTLITKVLANQKLQADLPTVQVKVRHTRCIATNVPTAVSCSTNANAGEQTLLWPGRDYTCSSSYKSTTICYADIWDKETTAFTGALMTYTDVHTKSGLLISLTQTSYQQATVTGSSTRRDEIEVIMDDRLKNKIMDLAQQQCLRYDIVSHNGDTKRWVDKLLTCDPIKDLPLPVQMQLERDIGSQMMQGFMLPAAWVQYWVSIGVTRNQLNIALWSIMGVSVLEAINQMNHGLGTSIPVKLSDINAALVHLGVLKPTTTTSSSSSSTSDPCQMCKTSGAACNVNPEDPQGEDGDPPIWPFATLTGDVTKPLKFPCKQGVIHENSQTWCNCGKTKYIKFPMTYSTLYRGSTTVITENCPYVKTPPPDYLKYTAPTNSLPVSNPLIVTAAPTNTFRCRIASSSREDWQKTWCACPDGKGYGMTKHVYGIEKGGSTSWTTDTCGYTAPPSSIWVVETNAPTITPGEAKITERPNVHKPGDYMAPKDGKYHKYGSMHWNSRSATSIATKFCEQMSISSKSFIGTDVNTLLWNEMYWNGQPTERSYPVPTDPVGYYPSYSKPKALKIRLTHDPRACNSTQKLTGCKFDFRNKERCEHWLLTAIESVDTNAIYDYYDMHFRKPFGMNWVPPVQLSGDGIVWQLTDGKECVQPPSKYKGKNVPEKSVCYISEYLEDSKRKKQQIGA